MIDKRFLNFYGFLNESKNPAEGVVMGSYTRLPGQHIKISALKFNEDSLEPNLPGINIDVKDKICLLSYGDGEDMKNTEVPTNSIEFPGERENPEEIKIISDSKWAVTGDNLDLLYEFIEDYLTSYYNAKNKVDSNDIRNSIDSIEILISELGGSQKIEELEKSDKLKQTFIGSDERFYKFKRKDSAPISSVEIYEMRGAKDPQISIKFGKSNECSINMFNESYKISRGSISELKSNKLLEMLMSNPKIKESSDTEDLLKSLLKDELELKGKYGKDPIGEGNISFLSEALKSFCDVKEVESFIRENTL